MKESQILIKKLFRFLTIMLVSVVIVAGISAFVNQNRIYRSECEKNLLNIVDYLANIMQTDGDGFKAYREFMLEYSDEIMIPLDYDGNYKPAEIAFHNAFNKEYPGKTVGVDIAYDDMSKDLKILYATYKHEYWLYIFESAREQFDVAYTYFVVPTGEYLHMYYMIDAVREKKTVNGKDYIYLNLDVIQPMDNHEHMWHAWNTGEKTPGYDVTNNEFGINCAYFTPLVINGEKMGVVGADMSILRINKEIFSNTIFHILNMAVVIIIIGLILAWLIATKYISRIVTLTEKVTEYAQTKDPDIADAIKNSVSGNDEISELSYQIVFMIREIDDYMTTILDKNHELLMAHEQIKIANELANKDALTGIRNKNAYDYEVKQIEERIADEGFKEFGIAMVDLNYLKYINDNYGHEKGNVAIKKICRIVCEVFKYSPVFRIGGDEFVVVMEKSDFQNAEKRVDRFKKIISDIEIDDSLAPWEKVSAAIGWTLYDPDSDNSVQNVFKRADEKMYMDKKEMKAERDK